MAEAYTGEIRLFAGNFAPQAWAFCSGQLLSIAQNTTLFSLIGTYYGGDGRVTFGLPDLRGRVPVSVGQGTGLTNRDLGEISGQETVALIQSELPAHTHAAQCTSNGGTQIDPTINMWARQVSGVTAAYQSAAPDTNLAPQAVGLAGSNLPHQNMQPYLACNYIICLFGTYPPRS